MPVGAAAATRVITTISTIAVAVRAIAKSNCRSFRPAFSNRANAGAIIVAGGGRILAVADASGSRARTTTVVRTPVVAIAVMMAGRPIAVMHIPVVVDRNTRMPIVVTVVMMAVIRMTPVTRVINVQVVI